MSPDQSSCVATASPWRRGRSTVAEIRLQTDATRPRRGAPSRVSEQEARWTGERCSRCSTTRCTAGALSGDGNDFHIPDMLLRDMSEEQLRLSPRDDQNSVAWLLWHIARCEDVVGGAILSSGGQVLDDGWDVKMGVPRRDIGTGMTRPRCASSASGSTSTPCSSTG